MLPAANSSKLAPLRPHPHLYEINTWVWLDELTQKAGKKVTLGSVPDAEWDALARLGFDIVWLMGVWQHSPESRRIFQTDTSSFAEFEQALPGWQPGDVVGSPYAVQQYCPDPHIGTWEELDQVRAQLHARGMRLFLDFVPNHTALDHPWTRTHPEYYLWGGEEDFRANEPAFFHVQSNSGKSYFLARAKDPYFPPWKDAAQLNLFSAAARAALSNVLREIAKHCDGVRCDMAMLVLNDVFLQTWGWLSPQATLPTMEFWPEAFAAVPNFLWLAEVYWGRERQLQQLGFSFTYDKRLYDALRDSRPDEIRRRLKDDLSCQGRMARFLENHDEARSAVVFAGRLQAVGTLLATWPGLRFYHQGQLEGRKIQLPLPLGRTKPEPPDPQVVTFYDKTLSFANRDVFHNGRWQLLDVSSVGDAGWENLIAYEWRLGKTWKVVVVNLSPQTSQARVHFGTEISASGTYVFFDELNDARYLRDGGEISRSGLYVRLEGYRAHLFHMTPT